MQDAESAAVLFANVALYAEEQLIKVETTDEEGNFSITQVAPGNYRLVASYLGAPDLTREVAVGTQPLALGILQMAPAAVELTAATVTARRAIVEIKPDRTVFNVQGTINAVGENGLDLLRKAPGVTVDNNDNINVLSRSGVLVYVDGKRLPLGGEDLANYLRNLTAEQIDRIDIITNPGAKYEAEGNAGIIDIRLKKNENEGSNGSLSATASQGRYFRYTLNGNANYRNRWLNIFGSAGLAENKGFNEIMFANFQNNFLQDETLFIFNRSRTPSYRFGTDFFLNDKHTVGFLAGGTFSDNSTRSFNNFDLFTITESLTEPDSLLRASTEASADRNQNTFNLNYRFDGGNSRTLNIDLDYGRFRNDNFRDQPNAYLDPESNEVTSRFDNYFDTPTDIDIATATLDYERPLADGQLGLGLKTSLVRTKNTFLFFNVAADGQRELNVNRSNQFDYDELVYAAYANYAGQLNEKISFSAGLRAEVTDATGELQTFNGQQEPPVNLDYLSLFPSAGLTYALNPRAGNTLSLNYGRRINRPDYNVLNPFRNQLSQLSYERGNPQLNPEIVDNIELGYTLAYRYNFKLAFSRTSNQITRLLGPDELDPRASFVGWDNLATQTNYSFSAALPFTVTKKWDAFFNLSAGYLDNQATYENGATIDLQAFTYTLFTQHTFKLGRGFTGELGGYFSGPGVWGGVFRYQSNGSFNVGLQKRFFNEQLNVKLSGNDLFFTTGWEGFSEFNGLRSEGEGTWDSRRITLSLSYALGNQKVKSRQRKTGIGEAAKRAGGSR